MKFPDKLQKKIDDRVRKNALRSLVHLDEMIDFSSNDYLGFARSKKIYEKANSLLSKQKGSKNGSSGSRLISGNSLLIESAEKQLSFFFKSESALIFNSGYNANLGILSSVIQRGDLVFYDEFSHTSIREGLQLCNGHSIKFKHNDLDDLKTKFKLQKKKGIKGNIYLITEAVFSMDGDCPDLKSLVNFTKNEGIYIILDEAHSTGIFGKNGQGLAHELEVHREIFARIITFGKSFGTHGAAILGSKKLRKYLINFSRSFIYTTAPSPHTVATIIIALKEIAYQKNKKPLLDNIKYFKKILKKLDLNDHFIPSNSAIMSCVLAGNEQVKAIEKRYAKKGFSVKAILSPTVPSGKERLRFCLHSYNTKEQIQRSLEILDEALG